MQRLWKEMQGITYVTCYKNYWVLTLNSISDSSPSFTLLLVSCQSRLSFRINGKKPLKRVRVQLVVLLRMWKVLSAPGFENVLTVTTQ